jgi:two-component system cell cycle response regulator
MPQEPQRSSQPPDAIASTIAPPPQVLPPPPSQRSGVRDPSKILVVEDNPVLLRAIVALLAATGEHVLAATNGDEALRIIAAEAPRLVISDWEMPGTDGLELCRRIRRQDGSGLVYFIMLTVHCEKSRLIDAYNAGVDNFISQPFDLEEFLARVRTGLRAARMHDETARKAIASRALNAQLATVNSRLERLAITDELTGLFNRRQAMFHLNEQWALAERYGRPLTVAMIDIDHFKQVNDTYGHDVGDAVLRRVAIILREQTRGTDALCRIGGEEFLIIFPAQTLEEARICAQRCRAAMEAQVLTVNGVDVTATISIGLASRTPAMHQFPDLLKAADEALYVAKSSGRNLVRDTQSPAAHGPVASHFAPKAPVDPARPHLDLSAVLERCGGDANFAAAVTAKSRAQADAEVARIESALIMGDADGLRRAAHME